MKSIALLALFIIGNSPLQAADSVKLIRTIGSKNPQDKAPFNQVCEVAEHQLENLKEVRSLLTGAEKQAMQKAFLFRPYNPTFRYEAYKGQAKILLLAGGDSLQTRAGEAATQLVKLLDSLCSSYDRKPMPKKSPSLPSNKTKK